MALHRQLTGLVPFPKHMLAHAEVVHRLGYGQTVVQLRHGYPSRTEYGNIVQRLIQPVQPSRFAKARQCVLDHPKTKAVEPHLHGHAERRAAVRWRASSISQPTQT